MQNSPFLKDLGLEFLAAESGEAEIALNLGERHTNSWRVMHGGVTTTLLDVSMARAARTLDPKAVSAATVELKITFFQPGGCENERVVAKGKVLHRSTTMYYCEGEVWNGDLLVAKGMGTFKTIRRSDIGRKFFKKTA